MQHTVSQWDLELQYSRHRTLYVDLQGGSISYRNPCPDYDAFTTECVMFDDVLEPKKNCIAPSTQHLQVNHWILGQIWIHL